MHIILILLAALVLLYVLMLRGRTDHPLLPELRKWKYAHRGLHGDGVPENSMQAFRLALANGYGIELDVHLLADGNLAVIHDSSLKRTAGADIRIEDLTTERLSQYHLENTGEIIPTFQEVLDLFADKAPMIIELKAENNNHALLSETVCKKLESYRGLYCIESFDPRCIRWLKKNKPEVVRGQLAHNSLREKSTVPVVLRFCMTNLLSNFWNRPDFIAYRFSDRRGLSVRISRKLWRVQGVSWTLQNQEDLDTAVKENWIPIFEGFKP